VITSEINSEVKHGVQMGNKELKEISCVDDTVFLVQMKDDL
jgi:hypothetical protein